MSNLENKLAEAVRGLLRARNIAARISARKFAEEVLAAHEAEAKNRSEAALAPTEPVALVDGLTPHQFALRELYEFQQATGCDTAAEFVAVAPAAPATITDAELDALMPEEAREHFKPHGYKLCLQAMRAAIEASKKGGAA